MGPSESSGSSFKATYSTKTALYVHLTDINESHNYHNGSPSDVLAVIPIENKSFDDIVTVRFERREFKRLKNGAVTELELVVKDENNNAVDNHHLPVSCVFGKKLGFFLYFMYKNEHLLSKTWAAGG